MLQNKSTDLILYNEYIGCNNKVCVNSGYLRSVMKLVHEYKYELQICCMRGPLPSSVLCQNCAFVQSISVIQQTIMESLKHCTWISKV